MFSSILILSDLQAVVNHPMGSTFWAGTLKYYFLLDCQEKIWHSKGWKLWNTREHLIGLNFHVNCGICGICPKDWCWYSPHKPFSLVQHYVLFQALSIVSKAEFKMKYPTQNPSFLIRCLTLCYSSQADCDAVCPWVVEPTVTENVQLLTISVHLCNP